MRPHTITALGFCALAAAPLAPTAQGGSLDPLALTDSGRSKYSIVIGKNADYGEDRAAKELAHFLFGMTGAEFPVIPDTESATDFEIVIGNTNRKSLEDIPANLRTDNWEGFTLFREGAKLYIMGNIPRGTLYGVYDFLDVELGVRFLTAEANHVPHRPVLNVAMKSRKYGPPIERRTIWGSLGGRSIVRNRMNGHSFQVADERLGGVKWVGHPTHSFGILVSWDEHFDEHPEYFSLIDGERKEKHLGITTQLCMTNPEVREVALGTIRGWLGDQAKSNPYTKYVVSVTINDNAYFCECETCVAVNKEEGVKSGGNLMRFVNSIAGQLDKEYGNVNVETMIYFTELPKKTKPASNVIIQAVNDPDWRYALDDPTNETNRKVLKYLRDTRAAIGEGKLYIWNKLGLYNSASFVDPRPNLRYIARNIRIMTENSVKGYFVQTVQTRGGEMQDLRYYLTARALWRPEVDSRETMKEFCDAYYGAGGDDVIRYIEFLHDEYGHKEWGSERFGTNGWMVNPTWIYDDNYLRKGDEILAAAAAKVDTPEMIHRIATCRMPIWKIKLDRAFGEVGKVYTFPLEWAFQIDPEDKGLVEQWQKTTDFKNWKTMPTDKHWTFQGEDHRGVGWYGIDFETPREKVARPAIWFGAVDGDADIYLDGEKIGEQKLPATSMWQHGFFIPIEKGLAPGRHTLVVRVFKDHANAGIWKPISLIDMSVPISDDLRTAGERFVTTAKAADLSFISESYGGRYTQTEKMYYPKVKFFLTHGQTR